MIIFVHFVHFLNKRFIKNESRLGYCFFETRVVFSRILIIKSLWIIIIIIIIFKKLY